MIVEHQHIGTAAGIGTGGKEMFARLVTGTVIRAAAAVIAARIAAAIVTGSAAIGIAQCMSTTVAARTYGGSQRTSREQPALFQRFDFQSNAV